MSELVAVTLCESEEPHLAVEGEDEMPKMIYKAWAEATCGCKALCGFRLPDLAHIEDLKPEEVFELASGVLIEACSRHGLNLSVRVEHMLQERTPDAPPSPKRVCAILAEALAGL